MRLSPIEQRLHREQLERKAFETLFLSYEESATDPNEFRNVEGFTPEEIDRDLEFVTRSEEKFKAEDSDQKKENLKKAQLLEALIFTQAELFNWFGENTFTVRVSRYDDIVNGTDVVLEVVDEDNVERLALAIDLTTEQSDPDRLQKKINSIITCLSKGTLGEVKYFKSEAEDMLKQLKGVPKVVIGADIHTLYELLELSINKDRKALAQHPIQRQLLEEMEYQLRVFATLLRERYKNEVAAKKLDTSHAIIQDMLSGKEGIDTRFRGKDKTYGAIMSTIEKLKH